MKAIASSAKNFSYESSTSCLSKVSFNTRNMFKSAENPSMKFVNEEPK